MLNHQSRMRLVGGVWLAAVVTIVASSVAAGASLSTSALLLLVCVVPVGVALFIGRDAPPPRVAELLYAIRAQKERRR